jgi:serine/threonine-protein kinase
MARGIKYTRVQVLAKGGIARITLGIQPDGRKVAVRELLPRHVLRPRIHWGFVRGTRIREQLSPHPQMTCSFETGHAGIIPYEVIEYVPGENLRERIIHRDECIRAQPLEILRQAALAIAHVHAQQFLHLDIKAENYLVDTTDGQLRVKLTDFDLSRRYGVRSDPYRSGTASYMSPEQLTAGQIGFESDIFAFGVMAYYLVTGKRPFSGFTIEELRRRQVSHSFEIIEPRRLNPDLMPKLNHIILACLKKDPAKRFPNMAYLCQELGAS